jgi:uncharacterized membrane protein YfcA|tara:strand:+ start:41 stop:832 length:792 start_codon:yes stop_codon:yes gene_type:complete
MPEYIALYLLLGVFSGFLAGMLGIGGGVVIVPALYLIYTASNKFSPELALLVALATSLTCITLTSASAAWAQIRAQRVHWDAFSGLLPWLLVGSAASGFIAPLLPSDLLRTLLGCLLGCVAVVMLLSWQPHPQRTLPGRLGYLGVGTGAGIVSGCAGIAGGNVIVPTLIFFNVPAHNATATSSVLGIPLAGVAALSYFLSAPAHTAPGLLGYLDVSTFLAIVVGAIATAPLGVRMAQRVNARRLRQLFAVVLATVALRMLFVS